MFKNGYFLMVTRKSTPKLSMYIQKETITMQISTKQLCSLQIIVTLFLHHISPIFLFLLS